MSKHKKPYDRTVHRLREIERIIKRGCDGPTAAYRTSRTSRGPRTPSPVSLKRKSVANADPLGGRMCIKTGELGARGTGEECGLRRDWRSQRCGCPSCDGRGTVRDNRTTQWSALPARAIHRGE